MEFKKASVYILLSLTLVGLAAARAEAGSLTRKSGLRPGGADKAAAYSFARSEQDLPATDAQEGVPLAAPAPETHKSEPAAVVAETKAAEEPEVTDIYAADPNKPRSKFKLQRTQGDTDVLLLPSARPLEEGQVHFALDEFLLWRAEIGVSDEFSLGADSVWGLTAQVYGKYAFIRENNTAVSLRVGAGAATVQKSLNWSYAQLLYAKDMRRGAYHLGAHLVFVHTPNGDSYLVPQGTLGGEVKLIKYLTAIGEAGFGNDMLQADGFVNNTGFVNLGAKVYMQGGYVTAGLVMPTNESFLNSAALGIPFIRFGYVF